MKENIKNMSEAEKKAFFLDLMREDQKRKMSNVQAAIAFLDKKVVPTPKEIISVINSTITERRIILSHHAFWQEKKIRSGLKAIIDVAHDAYVDICRHKAALISLSERYDKFRQDVDSKISVPLQKDVMAFCTAAHACIDTTRRLKSCRPDIAHQIDTAVKTHLTGDIFEFVKSLRRNLSHGSVIMADWNLTSDKDSKSGAMIFRVDELLRFGEWNAGAKAYLQSLTKGYVDTAEAMGSYNQGLIKFSRNMEDIFARNRTSAEIDYYNIEDIYRRTASGQWMKLTATQIAANKNPYDFLHRFFNEEEQREILRRPNNSKEQADYIISLRSVETACDDELRAAIYKLFKVA